MQDESIESDVSIDVGSPLDDSMQQFALEVSNFKSLKKI